MKGKIRVPLRNSRCPKCGDAFQDASSKGYFCVNCLTTPKRFNLDVSFKGQRIRIFCDKQGKPLDTFQRALNLLGHVNYEMENYLFDPSKYVKAEQKEFYTSERLDDYLSKKINSLAPSYQADFKRQIRIAREFFNTKDVREIKKNDIINYQEYLQQNFKICNKTVKNILDVFKAFLNSLKNDLEIISVVPHFPTIEYETKLFKWLSQEDQIKLFEFVPDKHKPIVAFLMLHGCRPSEARALKCKNVDLKNKSIIISATFSKSVYRERRKGKKSKPYYLPIHSESYDYMLDRVKNNLPEAFVFINHTTGKHYCENKLRIIWKDVRVKAGIDNSLRLYDATRHSYASNHLINGTPLSIVSKGLGHSTTKMTEKYSHSGLEDLRTSIEKLSLNSHQTVSRDVLYAKI